MAMVNFKKGLRSGLPATYAEGTFYVTTDERAIYLDVSDSARIRLGDFQEFATIEALTANTNPSTTALYYVSDINCLAKWNGSEYVQINKDTGCTSIEVIGDGNAVTAAVYSADNRKITLTKGATYMTAADVDAKISNANGELVHNGTTYSTVAEFVNAKTAGIATDAALGDLQTRVATNESDIDALQAAIGETGDVTTAISAAQSKADEAAEAAAAAQSTADSKVTMAEVEAKDYATKTEAQAMADAKDEAIATAKAAADAAQGDVDALAGKVGEVPADKTVVQMIADAQSAATYDDTQVKADIAANASAIDAIEADYLKAADKTELNNAIQAEADRAAAAEKVNADAIAAVKEDVDAFLASAEVGEAAVDTLKEIQEYITSDGSAAATMTQNIADNKAAIEAEVKRAGDAEAALSGRLDALEAIDHEHANMDVLNGITAEKVSAWDAAQANAEATAAAALASAKSELEGKITAEADRAKGIEGGLETRLAAVEADYLKAADKEELAGDIADVDAKFDNYSTTEQMNAAIKVVDDKFANYSTTEQMNAAIKVEADRAAAAESALSGRLDVLEAIDHDAYVAADEQVLADAKAHTEGLLTWGSF